MNISPWKRLLPCALILVAGLLTGNQALASTDDISTGYFNGETELGYRNVWLEGDKSRVLEYSGLNNGATGELLVEAGTKQKRFHLFGSFLNDQDYRGGLGIDLNGLVRVELDTDSMVHNLEHLPGAPPNDYLSFEDHNPQAPYQVEVERNSAGVRLKHPDYPAHFNLGYSRQERTGHQQLRFVDEGNGNLNGNLSCGKCHLQSKSRTVDWETNQFNAGVDVHVGPVDILLEHLYREFRDNVGAPIDSFGSHGFPPGVDRVGPADYRHDETPDSRMNKTTLELHTSLAGGLVGAASASIGSMQSESKLDDVSPVRADTDFYQLAGDATYIISPRWVLNFRYRMADLDSQVPNAVTAIGTLPANGPLPVRDSIDITRSSYEAQVSYRPNNAYTLKGEYRYLDIQRGNIGGPVDFAVSNGIIIQPDLSWELPDEETIQRFKLEFSARPLQNRKLRFRSHYNFETANDTAYGTSFEQRQDLFGNASWTDSRWGLQGSARYTKEENDDRRFFLPNGSGGFLSLNPARDREMMNLIAGAWLKPSERVTINVNYGYLQTAIKQDLIFGGQPSETSTTTNFAIFDGQVPFDQAVHTATIMVDVRILNDLVCSLEARLISSKSSFDPDFPVTSLDFSGTAIDMTSDNLKEISAIEIIQTGVTFGIDWQLHPSWTCSASYSYDDYDDQTSYSLEGTAQTVMASLAYDW